MLFCDGRKIDPFHPSLNETLEFLLGEFEGTNGKVRGLGYSAINSIRSAISAIATIDKVPAGQHPGVCQFMKAVFRKRPALPKYKNTWDPDIVL